ncbi:hypothetical protein [Pseudohalioglobus lutimaris]|uniref:hypothetical protein n=1 Tax=Pseudohalioglobus lutimaris TaxID=1737061 RepID=UPI0012F86E15|nr:hypothetical protein [Pseudohalioglobus lutimaris]
MLERHYFIVAALLFSMLLAYGAKADTGGFGVSRMVGGDTIQISISPERYLRVR